MKTKSYLIGLALLAAGLITITTTNNKAQAQGNSRQTSAEVLIVHSTHNSNPSYPVGIFPYLISGSQGAPKLTTFPNPDAIQSAQVIADCLNAGYEIKFIDNASVVLVKPAGH